MKDTIEGTPRVSVGAIHRAVTGEWTHGPLKLPVERDGQVTAFAFALPIDRGERLLVEHVGHRYLIALVRRPLPLGGVATLLACPECEETRRHLFLRPQRIACRRCLGLVYDGQQRHRAAGYELNARPRRALAKIRAALARVRSPTRKSKLMARAETMLKLLDEGMERQAVTLRKLEERAARLAKARLALGARSPTPVGKPSP